MKFHHLKPHHSKPGSVLAAVVAALVLTLGVLPRDASADETIKIGTLAPKQSIWGQVFQVWETAVKKKSDGKLALQFFYNGQQGDEDAMVGKMKAGQLDGAAITAVGLSKIYKPVNVLAVPGALRNWEQLEKAQSELQPELEKGIKEAGFDLLGWGNVGQAHLFAKSEVKTPDQLKTMKPFVWRADVIQPVLYQVIGATPVPGNIPEVLAGLKTGNINALTASALAVEQLQWASELKTVNDDVPACAIGAVVVTSTKMKALPGDLRTILTDTGAIAAKALGQKVKDEDKASYERLKGKMTVVKTSDSEKAAWEKVFKETRKRLGQGTFDPALIAKVEKIGGV